MRPVRYAVGGLLAIVVLGGCSAAPSSPTTVPSPAASVDDSASAQAPADMVTIVPGDFQIAYRLDAAVVASPAVVIEVPNGMRFVARDGVSGTVTAGTRLGRVEGDPAVLVHMGAGSVDASRRAAIDARTRAVEAPLGGPFTANGTPTIRKSGLDLVADLSPLQVLRYEGAAFRGTATTETVLGQQTVTCVAVWIERDSKDAGGGRVHCRLPVALETTAGIPGVLNLTTHGQADVIAVPLRFVGLDKAGENYVVEVAKGSGFERRSVVVGPTDGVRRVLLAGVDAGETLAPVPPA